MAPKGGEAGAALAAGAHTETPPLLPAQSTPLRTAVTLRSLAPGRSDARESAEDTAVIELLDMATAAACAAVSCCAEAVLGSSTVATTAT